VKKKGEEKRGGGEGWGVGRRRRLREPEERLSNGKMEPSPGGRRDGITWFVNLIGASWERRDLLK